jgi:UDP-2-acetamido-2-deoxy-ribo-hexuluronate aminotransferase
MHFIDLEAQYRAYQSEIDAAIAKVLKSSQFILGQEVIELEAELAHYTGAKHAISCANGTDALMLALMAIDIQPGDEVITPSFTFIATAEAAAILGARPVLVDIEAQSYNIDVNLIKAAITKKTRAIMPVSLYGQVADMDEINAIAEQYSKKFGHKIYVIEDAAQSFGAEYKGRKSCNLSDIACTSFFPSKPLGCYGDGGAVLTSDDALADKIKAMRVHGQTGRYQHTYIGLNSRLDTIQAAVLNVKLKYFDTEINKRHELGAHYNKLLAGEKIITPTTLPDRTHIFAQYSICAPEREVLIKSLKAAGIPTAVHYPMPIHAQPCFHYLGYTDADFPVSVKIAKEIVSLPMSAFLTMPDLEKVVSVLLN